MINELINTTGAEVTISRDTYPTNKPKNYETVIVRQGKFAIDAEVNEMQDLALNERLEFSRDTFQDGCLVGNVFGDGIIRNSYNVTWDGVNVHVASGRMRLSLRRCDLLADLSSGVAGNALSGFVAPVNPGDFKFLYVDVYRREYLGNLLNPNSNATPTVPGNDTYLPDPTLGAEQARRIQWFNPSTDIQATALNTAIPAPALGHTIFPLAKVQMVGAMIVVTDLRTFGGVKAVGKIYTYVVKQTGIVGIDCTHTDIVAAITDATNLLPTLAANQVISIFVVNGTFVIPGAGQIVIPSRVSIEAAGRINDDTFDVIITSDNTVSGVSLFNASSSTTFKNIKFMVSAASGRPFVFECGNNSFVKFVDCSIENLGVGSAIHFNTNTAHFRMFGCHVTTAAFNVQNLDTLIADCEFSGNMTFLGLEGRFVNCIFNSTAANMILLPFMTLTLVACIFNNNISLGVNGFGGAPLNVISCIINGNVTDITGGGGMLNVFNTIINGSILNGGGGFTGNANMYFNGNHITGDFDFPATGGGFGGIAVNIYVTNCQIDGNINITASYAGAQVFTHYFTSLLVNGNVTITPTGAGASLQTFKTVGMTVNGTSLFNVGNYTISGYVSGNTFTIGNGNYTINDVAVNGDVNLVSIASAPSLVINGLDCANFFTNFNANLPKYTISNINASGNFTLLTDNNVSSRSFLTNINVSGTVSLSFSQPGGVTNTAAVNGVSCARMILVNSNASYISLSNINVVQPIGGSPSTIGGASVTGRVVVVNSTFINYQDSVLVFFSGGPIATVVQGCQFTSLDPNAASVNGVVSLQGTTKFISCSAVSLGMRVIQTNGFISQSYGCEYQMTNGASTEAIIGSGGTNQTVSHTNWNNAGTGGLIDGGGAINVLTQDAPLPNFINH